MSGVGLADPAAAAPADPAAPPAPTAVGEPTAGQPHDSAVSTIPSARTEAVFAPAVEQVAAAASTGQVTGGHPVPAQPTTATSTGLPVHRACGGAAPVLAPEPSALPTAATLSVVAVAAQPVTEAVETAVAQPQQAGRPGRGAPLTDAPLLERLVARSVEGDVGARDQLLAEIHPLVLRYCRGRLGRQETVIGSADDVAQEVCLAVVGALPNYTIKGLSFRAFVYGIAAHKVTDAFRAIGRNKSEPMADLPDTAVTHDGPEQRLLAGELAERLGGMLHRLTPRQREVLILRIVAGLSAEEVAQIVGSTPGAVRVTQHRALNRLRAVLAGRPGQLDGIAALRG